MNVHIVIPAASEGQVSHDLIHLTETLSLRGEDTSGGALGGEFGYGAWFENSTFQMTPYCWCTRGDCPWCVGCTCPEGAVRYYLADAPEVPVKADVFFNAGGYRTGTSEPVPEKQCDYCAGRIEPAPNFVHKPSGSKVSWYKWIGRGMELDLAADWGTLFAECLASLDTDPTNVHPLADHTPD